MFFVRLLSFFVFSFHCRGLWVKAFQVKPVLRQILNSVCHSSFDPNWFLFLRLEIQGLNHKCFWTTESGVFRFGIAFCASLCRILHQKKVVQEWEMSTRGSSSLSLPCGHFLKWVLLLLLLTVLKPLSAECHVIMDQSSEIVLDTPKVNKKESRKNCLQDT